MYNPADDTTIIDPYSLYIPLATVVQLSFIEYCSDRHDTQQGNPLQEAAQLDNDKAFHILLENGADVNRQGGRHGW